MKLKAKLTVIKTAKLHFKRNPKGTITFITATESITVTNLKEFKRTLKATKHQNPDFQFKF